MVVSCSSPNLTFLEYLTQLTSSFLEPPLLWIPLQPSSLPFPPIPLSYISIISLPLVIKIEAFTKILYFSPLSSWLKTLKTLPKNNSCHLSCCLHSISYNMPLALRISKTSLYPSQTYCSSCILPCLKVSFTSSWKLRVRFCFPLSLTSNIQQVIRFCLSAKSLFLSIPSFHHKYSSLNLHHFLSQLLPKFKQTTLPSTLPPFYSHQFYSLSKISRHTPIQICQQLTRAYRKS